MFYLLLCFFIGLFFFLGFFAGKYSEAHKSKTDKSKSDSVHAELKKEYENFLNYDGEMQSL